MADAAAAPVGTGKDEKKAVVAPEGAIIRVTCDANHPLSGLFVIWAPPEPRKEDARTPEDKILAVAEAHAAEPEPFSLGIVNTAGYLEPVLPDRNPWHDVFTQAQPFTFKLGAQRSYRFCLLRHPSVKLAREVTAFLNGKGTLDVASWGGKEAWGGAEKVEPASLVQLRELVRAKEAGEETPEEVLLTVAEAIDPDDYFPKGHALYDAWTLYPDMPGLSCRPVQELVARLQVHLVALRYPIGAQEAPYRVDAPKAGGNRGQLDLRTAAGLARFQEHAREGKAFKVDAAAKSVTHGALVDVASDMLDALKTRESPTTSWDYLLGLDGQEVAKEHLLESAVPGLMDIPTGDALLHWIQQGYRKPGKLLLRIPGTPAFPIYLREDAALQVETWRKLVELFGVSYGLPSGHSFRNISNIQRGQKGVLNNSIHKTGMAIDFAVNGKADEANYTRPVKYWPIRMEQRFDAMSKDPVASRRKRLEASKKEQMVAEEQRRKDLVLQAAHAVAGPPPPPPLAPAVPVKEPETSDEALRLVKVAKAKVDAARKQELAAIAVEKKSPAHLARATVAIDKLVAAEDAWLAALTKEIALLEAEIEKLARENQRTKNAYRMRWCLYGHSSSDPYGAARKEVLEALRIALAALGTTLENQFAGRFDASLKTQATAWVREVATKVLPFGEIGEALAKELATPEGRADVVAKYFRSSIRPFLPDPYEADGGTSAETDLRPGADRPGVSPKLTDFTGTAKSFVNVSSLGHLCGMYSIGTAGTGWKLGFQTLNATQGFASIARMLSTAGDHPDAQEQPVIVARSKGVQLVRAHSELDVAFLGNWANALDDLLLAPASATPAKKGARPGRSKSITVNPPQLTVALPPPELKDDAQRIIGKLKGDFSAKRFFVVAAGQETGLAELVTAGVLTGKVLGAKLEAAFKAFEEKLTAAKPAVKAPAGKGKTAAPKRDRTWLEVTIQPVFEKAGTPGSTAAVAFLPKDQVQVSAPGVPRTLEWWHYQSKYAFGGSWEEQVNEIGFSDVYLTTSPDAEDQEGGAMDGRGLGYTGPEMESTRGGMALTNDPGNVWHPPPKGW